MVTSQKFVLFVGVASVTYFGMGAQRGSGDHSNIYLV